MPEAATAHTPTETHIRDPYRILRLAEDHHIPAMGHEFDASLRCPCKMTWQQHQESAKTCPLIRGKKFSLWLTEPARWKLEKWADDELAKLLARAERIEAKERMEKALEHRA